MRKFIMLLLAVLLTAALFAGCAKTPNTPNATDVPAAESLKTGLAILTSVSKSKDAGEADGLAQADSTIVAVTVDSSGKITGCVIDAAQSKVNFNTAGELTTPLDTIPQTKNELGEAYGMKEVSPIGKEWSEQAAAFAEYVVGKTVDEVKNIAVSEGYATDADLKSSVTIHVTDFIAGVEKAVANATDLGAKAGDTLKLATVTNINKSKNATADAEGVAQIYSTYVALTQDSAGKITSCIFDASISNVNFTSQGVITTDLSVAPSTKNELKENYGMGKVSSIGKEWYQQAAAFAAYVTGKTAEEAKGIAISEQGVPTVADLTSSVTIHVNDLLDLIEKAAQ